MKAIFTVFFAILAVLVMEAQSGGPYILQYIPHDSTNATPYLISHITSDYGPRNVPPGFTYWHRGIDYQPNKQRRQ